jgi:hypothetical protein
MTNAATPTAVLWCVNIHGPDDVIAKPDYLSAVKAANAFNAWWLGYRMQKPLHEQFDARMWAVPTEWPYDAASHAASLGEGSSEYDGIFAALEPNERLIETLTAALASVAADKGHVHLNDDTWFNVQTALAEIAERKGEQS